MASAAGALKDLSEAQGGPAVESPIFAHPQFEHLEAQGAENPKTSGLRRAVRLLARTASRRPQN